MRETEKKPANSIHQPTTTTKCKTLAEIELRNTDDSHLQTQTLDVPKSNNIAENGFRVSGDSGVKPEGTDNTDTEVDVGITLAQLSKKKVSGGGRRATTHQQQLQLEGVTDLSSSNGNNETPIASVGSESTVPTRRTTGEKQLDDIKQPNVVTGEDILLTDVRIMEESNFTVGEFVWGKVKTYPWWPGRVYDPSDASDNALNLMPQDGRHLLVAFFGDETFGWFDSSQMKPFVENFVEMSGQSTSIAFKTAVQDAANEFARLVMAELTDSSVPGDENDVVNAGIKEGVKPPRDGVRLYAVDGFQPKEVISDIRRLGKSVNAVDLLRRLVLSSQVSAICRGRTEELGLVGRCGERREDEVVKNGNFTGPPVEDMVVGGEHLDGLDEDETGPATSELGVLSSKRKSKSISEILDRATTAVRNEVTSDEDEEEDDDDTKFKGKDQSRQTGSKPRKNKRTNEVTSDEDEKDDDDDTKFKGKNQSRQTGSKPRKDKRRRVEILCKEAEETKDGGDGKLTGQSSKGKSNQRKGSKDGEQQVSAAAAVNITTTPSRQSQRLKGVAKPNDDHATESKDRKHKGKKREDSPPPSPVGSLEVVEMVSGPRERKKSKFLSPPFTNVGYSPKLSTILKALELEAAAASSNAAVQTGDGGVASSSTQLVSSAPDAKLSAQDGKVGEAGGGSGKNKAHHSSQQITPNTTDKKLSKISSIVSPNSVLSQVQSAALTAMPSGEPTTFDSVKLFLNLFRRIKFKNCSDYSTAAYEDGNAIAYERSSSRRTKSLYRRTKEKSDETEAPAPAPAPDHCKENADQFKAKKQADDHSKENAIESKVEKQALDHRKENAIESKVEKQALDHRKENADQSKAKKQAHDHRKENADQSKAKKQAPEHHKEYADQSKAKKQAHDHSKENASESKVKKQANATDIESRVKDPDAKKEANTAGNKNMGTEKSTKKQAIASDKEKQGQDPNGKKQTNAVGNESIGKERKYTKKQRANASDRENLGQDASTVKKQANAVDNKERQGKEEGPSSKPDGGHAVDDKSASSLSSSAGGGAALSLKFPPDLPLPSETDLSAMFQGFSIEESKTKVFHHSSSAKVVFLKSSDAKAAMQQCKEGNPFGSTAVTYRVRNLRVAPSPAAADAPVGNGNPDVFTPGGSSSVKTRSTTSKKKRSAPVALSGAEDGLKFVKRKLEEMTIMVGSADGKVTVEMKSNLEAEMKVLLEKVIILPAS